MSRSTLRASAPADLIDPRSIAGLVGWWDAQALTSLFQDAARSTPVAADSDPVGGWADLSASGIHLGQATAGKRPLYKLGAMNGRPAVLLDGTDDFMNATTSALQGTSRTILAALQPSASIAATKVLLCYTNNTNWYVGAVATNNLIASYDSTVPAQRTLTSGTPQILNQAESLVAGWMTRTDGTTVIQELTRNLDSRAMGNNTDGHNANANTALVLGAYVSGASLFFPGHVGEICIWNRALEPSERRRATRYLMDKWGIRY